MSSLDEAGGTDGDAVLVSSAMTGSGWSCQSKLEKPKEISVGGNGSRNMFVDGRLMK